MPASRATLFAPGDTVVIHGPRRYDAMLGPPGDSIQTVTTYVDSFPVTVIPMRRYVVRVKNGEPDGTQRVQSANVGGRSLTGQDASITFEIAVKATTTLAISIVSQPQPGHLTVEVLQIEGGNFAIFGTERFTRSNSNSDVVFTRTVTRGANAGAPFFLWLINGNANGTQRLAGVTVRLNSDTVIGAVTWLCAPPGTWCRPPVLTTGTALLMVSVAPVSGSNTLVITLPKKQAGFVDITVMATDITRPTLTIAAPAPGLITRQDTLTARGTASDASPFKVYVNGAQALLTNTGNWSKLVTLVEGQNNLQISAVDAAGNHTDSSRSVIRDRTPPVLTVNAPPNNFYTNQSSVTVTGTVTDLTAVTVTVNGVSTPVTNGAFSRSVALTEGSNTITVVATDAMSNTSMDTRAVIRDTQPPVLTVNQPANNFITKQTSITVSGTVADASPPVSVDVNGTPLVVDGAGAFNGTVNLVEGSNTLTITARDRAGNPTVVTRSGTRDTQAPVLVVNSPADGASVATPTVTVQGTVTDATAVGVTINGTAVTVTGGSFSSDVALTVGPNTITVIATDVATNADTVTRSVTRTNSGLPPDPATVATAIDPTVATNIATSTAFLYTGANPIQTGVPAGAINPVRAAVVRGRVLTRDGQPRPGATVAILGHPEYGQTLSRADGGYDLALNGGGQLTLAYTLNGYLSAQRQADVPWQDFVVMDDIRLVARDNQVTTISFTQPIEVARGSAVTDDLGTRRTTLLFAQGTHAMMVLPDSSLDTLSTIHVRATEFTVGPNGPEAMPAPLPPTSAYTWAADLNADEAVSANARAILFDKPVVVYLENFVQFPVGQPVPLGIYDLEKGVWNPIPNGRVVEIVDTVGGMARIAVDSSGQPASDSALAALGVTTDERTSLASLYAAGQKLWRMSTAHFSYIDGNWPWGPDSTKKGPKQPKPKKAKKQDDPCEVKKSIIECESQVLGEQIALSGTSSALNYRTAGVPGRVASRQMTVPLTDSVLPDGLRKVGLNIDIAGRRFPYEFAVTSGNLTPNLTQSFTWDGKDAYGRTVNGAQRAEVTIAYRYLPLYAVPADEAASFGLTCFGQAIGNFQQCQLPNLPLRESYFTERTQQHITSLGELTPNGVGGWTLDRQHSYDPYERTLYLGSGIRRTAGSANSVINTFAGNGTSGAGGDGGPATAASVSPDAVTIAPDGALLIADQQNNRVRRVAVDGTITTVVGNGSQAYSGDGGPALSAGIDPRDVKVGPDGSLYIADNVNHRIRRVGADGFISTVAGSPTPNCDSQGAGDGGPATAAGLCFPYSIAVGTDGSFYIADTWRVRRVDPSGIIMTVAGIDRFCNTFNPDDGPKCGDGRMAVRAPLNFIESIEVDRAGNLYIVDDFANVIRRVSVEGVITTVAGIWFGSGFAGDGGPAVQATLDRLGGMAMASDGGFYITDRARIRRVTSDGIIYTVAGGPLTGFAGDGGSALQAQINRPTRIAVGPDDAYYLAESNSRRVRRVAPPFPGFTDTQYAIASADGAELYQFDSIGRHVRTFDALLGAVVDTFVYDAAGRLLRIVNRNTDTLRIERDGAGTPTAIVAPFGRRTTLSTNAQGYLATITNAVGETFRPTYAAGGLLASLTDPRGHSSAFAYDSLGRLVSDSDAVGSVVHLDNVRQDSVTEVVFTSALGLSTTYRVLGQTEASTTITRSQTAAGGLQATITKGQDGTRTVTYPDGHATRIRVGPDSRFGTQVPAVDSFSLTTPGGLQLNAREARHVTLADPANPLSVTRRADTVFVNGQIYTSDFDRPSGLLTRVTPGGLVSRSRIDGNGRLVMGQLPGLDSITSTYGERGRPTSVTQGDRTTGYSYDSAGQLAHLSSALGHDLRLEHDSVGRVTTQILPDSNVIRFAHDSNGNVVSLTNPRGFVYGFAYDAVNLLRSLKLPNNGAGIDSITYEYDLDRRLKRISDPDVAAIDFDYDENSGRPRALSLAEGAVQYAFDSLTGNLTSVTAPNGTVVAFAYDGGLPVRASWSGPVTGSIETAYDNDLRTARMSVNEADTITYSFQDGLLIQARDFQITREGPGGRPNATLLGSVGTTASYSGFGELSGFTAAFGMNPLYAVSYTRDRAGRIITSTETLEGEGTTRGYEYDTRGRLLSVSMNGLPTASYEYDENGNRVRVTAPEGVITGVYDARDQLVTYGATTYTYSPGGKLLRAATATDTTRYTYNSFGSLVSAVISGGPRIDYVLDAANRRIGRKIDGTLVQGFLYEDQLRIVAQLDGSNTVVSRFVYGIRPYVPDFMIKGGVNYRLIADETGSVRLVINAETGEVAQRLDYDEFGRVTRNTSPGFQPFGFAGGLTDDDTKLVHFGAREYDPHTGRWTTQDPAAFVGGTNMHLYAGNDPVNFGDPSGLDPCDCSTQLLKGLDKGLDFHGDGVNPYFSPDVADKLSAAIRYLNSIGITPTLTDGYRTLEDQLNRLKHPVNGLPVCDPGQTICWHMLGYAADFNTRMLFPYPLWTGSDFRFQNVRIISPQGYLMISVLEDAGFRWAENDPVHFRLPSGSVPTLEQARDLARKLEDFFNNCIPHN